MQLNLIFIGGKENVNQYSRPNKGSGSKNSSTYDPSLASLGRKKSILQETSKIKLSC